MKKILSIVALALILCLGISAVAEGIPTAGKTYKPLFNGKELKVDPKQGFVVLAYEEVIKPSNWTIVPEDVHELPDSPKVEALRTLTNLFITSASAEEVEEEAPYTPVNNVYVEKSGKHGVPSIVHLNARNENETNGIHVQFEVLLEEDAHRLNDTEYAIQEDGYCHSRTACSVDGCNYGLAWSKEPSHKASDLYYTVENGVNVIKCTTCGQIVVNADGHKHVPVKEWEEEPNCLNGNEAIYYNVCEICGKYLSEDGKHKEEEPVLVHVPQANYVLMDDADEDYVKKYEDGTIDNEGHWYGGTSVLTDSTCTQKGSLIRTCLICQDAAQIIEDSIPTKDPVFPEKKIACNSTASLTVECKNCKNDPNRPETHYHTFDNGVADMTAEDLEKYNIVLDHKFDLSADPVEVPATCTASGTKTWYCTNNGCSNLDDEGATVLYSAELGHDWPDTWTEVITPDPENQVQGLWVKSCKRCLLTQRVIGWDDPNAQEVEHEHNYEVVPEMSEAATCTEDGYNWFECTICGDWYIEDVLHTGHVAGTVKEIKAATCAEEGMKLATCANCDYAWVIYTEKTNHKFGEWYIVREATKEEAGLKERKCANCDATEQEEVPYVVTADPEYTVSNFAYNKDAQEVTGHIAHTDDTVELEVVKARVSFYLADKTWFAVVVDVDNDGNFSVGTNVDAVYVKVNVMGDNATHHIPDPADVYGTGDAKIVEE